MNTRKGEKTIEERALQIEGFDKVINIMKQQMFLRNHSDRTLKNYVRAVASVCLKFNKIPDMITDTEINDYLTELTNSSSPPSLSTFKHTIFGLRYYFRDRGNDKRGLFFPPIKKEKKLPIILNKTELRDLFSAPRLFKHRLILTLIYSAGLRSSEIINLRIGDIDFERKTIHIHQGKHFKDRIVPLSEIIAINLKKYIKKENPNYWLFNGNSAEGKFSKTGLRWIMREAIKKASITKDVNLHSLRHSYATHLLEQGVNIVTIKELLGHTDINTTITYLHVALNDVIRTHSPMDRLYNEE